jgi:hypothetical protein
VEHAEWNDDTRREPARDAELRGEARLSVDEVLIVDDGRWARADDRLGRVVLRDGGVADR